jgi:hypothetical protein
LESIAKALAFFGIHSKNLEHLGKSFKLFHSLLIVCENLYLGMCYEIKSATKPIPSTEKLPHLQTIMVVGEACPPRLVAQWSVRRSFFNGYGPRIYGGNHYWSMSCQSRQAAYISFSTI